MCWPFSQLWKSKRLPLPLAVGTCPQAVVCWAYDYLLIGRTCRMYLKLARGYLRWWSLWAMVNLRMLECNLHQNFGRTVYLYPIACFSFQLICVVRYISCWHTAGSSKLRIFGTLCQNKWCHWTFIVISSVSAFSYLRASIVWFRQNLPWDTVCLYYKLL
jgi:hypothetical protein